MNLLMKGLVMIFVAGCAPVLAQTYPTKPVRMVIGFPPGGGTDIIGRIVAQKLAEGLGQQVIVDNRSGASGQIAADLVAKSPPDGHTVMMAHIGAMSILPSLYPKLPYDPVRDFAPISLVATSPNLVVVHPSLPVKNIKELIALAKARPDQLHYASPGAGLVQHLAGELFNLRAKVKIVHVPYKGAGPAIVDLIAGHVQLSFDVIPAALPYVKSGRLRAVAVTGEKRTALLPDIPTISESGLPGFDLATWWGLVAPAAVNKNIIGRLHAETVKLLPGVKDRIANAGADIVGNSPAEFAAYIQSEREKYARIVKEANIKID